MMQNTALLLGVSKEDTILQTEPGNTNEEAGIYSSNFGGSNPVILVTSAVHRPRAVILFQKAGIEPIPSPINYRLRGSWKEKNSDYHQWEISAIQVLLCMNIVLFFELAFISSAVNYC